MTKKEFIDAMRAILESKDIHTEVVVKGATLTLVHQHAHGTTSANLDAGFAMAREKGDIFGGIKAFADAFEIKVREADAKAKDAGNCSLDEIAKAGADIIAALLAKEYDVRLDAKKMPGTEEETPCIVCDVGDGLACIELLPLCQAYLCTKDINCCVSIVEKILKESCGYFPKKQTWDGVKDKLFIALRPDGYSSPGSITMPLADLGLTCEAMYRDGKDTAFPVKKSMLEKSGVSETEALMAAWTMSEQTMPGVILAPDEVMKECAGHGATEEALGLSLVAQMFPGFPTMYTVTNADMLFGASAILYNGMLEKIRDKVGGDYYLLPSSVHEMYALPVDCDVTADGLFGIVLGVNGSGQFDDTFLADALYRYENGRLSCIRKK